MPCANEKFGLTDCDRPYCLAIQAVTFELYKPDKGRRRLMRNQTVLSIAAAKFYSRSRPVSIPQGPATLSAGRIVPTLSAFSASRPAGFVRPGEVNLDGGRRGSERRDERYQNTFRSSARRQFGSCLDSRNRSVSHPGQVAHRSARS